MFDAEIRSSLQRLKAIEERGHELTRWRVNEILLCSSYYDAFIFEQDGLLTEQLYGEYSGLNLSFPPRVRHAASHADAMEALSDKRFDMVIIMPRLGDKTFGELAADIKAGHPDLPVVLLINNVSDRERVRGASTGLVDDVFLWTGDSKVFLAMIKATEDRHNIRHDTLVGNVRVILVVEDSVQHYSYFLPLLYSQIVKQTQMLINEGASESVRRARMRSRPKVISVHDFDEAAAAFREYKDYLIGIISDVQYLRGGRMDDQAGVAFLEMVRHEKATLPVLLQSAEPGNRVHAERLGACFADKNSSSLTVTLKDFIVTQLGFGDFVFRMPDGFEVETVSSVSEFIDALARVPIESVGWHAGHNHFSGWLMAHGEIDFARRIQPLSISNFESLEEVRSYLLNVFEEARRAANRGKVVDVVDWERSERAEMVRLAEGSMGGKGRGLAFLNSSLSMMSMSSRYPGVDVSLPLTAFIGTSEYDDFIEHNGIEGELDELPDAAIRERFLEGNLSAELKRSLLELVQSIDVPLAVRSSGLLEDSQACPLAGVYRTVMVPNSSAEIGTRYQELTRAVKLVFSSVYEARARQFLAGGRFKPRDEKMAVIVQEMVGRRHGIHFYPDLSGVAQSFNFYPTGSLRSSDGIASIALGLGRTIVDGGRVFRFCPAFPRADILTSRDLMNNAQKRFWALRLDSRVGDMVEDEVDTLELLDLGDAERHGVLSGLASRWDTFNGTMIPDLDGPGPRVLDFSGVLKYGTFPLADIVQDVMALGEEAFSLPIEVEFAANMTPGRSGRAEFFVLQIRPLAINKAFVEVPLMDWQTADPDVFLYSSESLGNGEVNGLSDVVMVDPDRFLTTETLEIKQEIAELNADLRGQERGYLLIGPGRWGSSDRFLGIPVIWSDISEAVAIVEMDLKDFRVESSQGTHFFHNLVARNAGYMKIRYSRPDSWLNMTAARDWSVVGRTAHCIHFRTSNPLTVAMDGRSGRAAVFASGTRLADPVRETGRKV